MSSDVPAAAWSGTGHGRNSRFSTLLLRLEVYAPRIMALLIVLWVAVIFAASVYKYQTFGQGYDQVDFEQAIWNTVHGRIMEDSRFNFTNSVFGMDWMPMLLFFVPVYALIPSPHVLFFLQILASGLGAIPVYLLARDRLGGNLEGLGFGASYLLYPTLLHTALNPFQVRLFALTLLLFGFYFYERGNWKLFYAMALLATLARTDVALVVMMFGVYGMLTRRSRLFVVPPLVIGLGYFALSTFVITPSFAFPGALTPPPPGVPLDMSCWPCGTSPQLAYYAHLGTSGPGILNYIFTHPLQVAQIMFTGAKIQYLVLLILPLAMLPLFAPRPLALGLPIVALNLLSLRGSQFDYQSHYSLLLIPGLYAAAIYGAGNLLDYLRAHGRLSGGTRPGLVKAWPIVWAVWALVLTVPYKNPVLRVIRSHESAAYVEAGHDLISMVGPAAKVAVTSKLGPYLLPRRYIYNFPPAPYSPYNLGPRRRSDYSDLDYILVDPKNSALDSRDNLVNGEPALDLLRRLPNWKLVASKQGIELYKRQ